MTKYTLNPAIQRRVIRVATNKKDVLDKWELGNLRTWRRALRKGESLPEFQLWYMQFLASRLQSLGHLPANLKILIKVRDNETKEKTRRRR